MTPFPSRSSIRCFRFAAAFLAMLAAAPADAQEVDCSTPSGVGTHACTFPEGQVVVETSVMDQTLDNGGGIRTKSVLVGDTIVHVGLTSNLEAQIGWTPYDYERTSNGRKHQTIVSSGVGGVTIGGKFALVSARDHPVGIAVQPRFVVPVGDLRLGEGRLLGGVALPVSYDLSGALTLELTPDVAYVGDREDDGRHRAYSLTLGLDATLVRRLSATIEYRIARDDDPVYRRTEHIGAFSFSYSPSKRWQLSAGAAIGLTSQSPRLELLLGIARHFR